MRTLRLITSYALRLGLVLTMLAYLFSDQLLAYAVPLEKSAVPQLHFEPARMFSIPFLEPHETEINELSLDRKHLAEKISWTRDESERAGLQEELESLDDELGQQRQRIRALQAAFYGYYAFGCTGYYEIHFIDRIRILLGYPTVDDRYFGFSPGP